MFRFRLQSILNTRVASEKEAAARLADARSKQALAEAQRAELQSAMAQGYARLSEPAGAPRPVGELRSRSYVLDQLSARMALVEDSVRRAQGEVQLSVERFAAAVRDRRVLDLLREKRLASWKTATEKAELATMDGIALTRFASGPQNPADPESEP